MVQDDVFKEYRCPHCDRMVPSTKFCKACYGYAYSEYLMRWIAETPHFRCNDCGAPRVFDPSGGLKPGPCGRCLHREFSFVTALTPPTPLTPEQLAHWLKGMKA